MKKELLLVPKQRKPEKQFKGQKRLSRNMKGCHELQGSRFIENPMTKLSYATFYCICSYLYPILYYHQYFCFMPHNLFRKNNFSAHVLLKIFHALLFLYIHLLDEQWKKVFYICCTSEHEFRACLPSSIPKRQIYGYIKGTSSFLH